MTANQPDFERSIEQLTQKPTGVSKERSEHIRERIWKGSPDVEGTRCCPTCLLGVKGMRERERELKELPPNIFDKLNRLQKL